jgi:signal transduction histidine kinase
VADASHDLRIPLTVIKGNLDLLRRNPDKADLNEALRAIMVETDRMTKMVSDLLLLAEIESGEADVQEVVSLKEILLEELQRARQLAGSRKILLGRIEDLSTKGDSHRVRRLLGNLVDNALKYTLDKGTITLSLFRDNGWACLEVADTGPGIARDDLPKIFDHFYRGDKSRSRAMGGIGLGLAIVRGIVEQYGGKVTVNSEIGKGSTFTAMLKL